MFVTYVYSRQCSSVSAILSTIFGVHYGHVLVHVENHADRLKHWIPMGLALLTLGLLLHFTSAIPLNKQLYSFSYVCVTSGAAALVFSAFYILVDILNMKLLFLPLKWIGMNAILGYGLTVNWIQKHIFIGVWHSRKVGILLYVIFAEIMFSAVVAGVLHRRKMYWKL